MFLATNLQSPGQKMDPNLAPLSRFAKSKGLPRAERSWEDCDLFRTGFVDFCRGDCDRNATEIEGILNTAPRTLRLHRIVA